MNENVICSICNRLIKEDKYIEKHHLIPKSKKGKETIVVCIDCGNQLHNIFTNKEMEKYYNTIERIKSDDRIQKWINWVCKKEDFGICMKRKKKRL